MMVPSEQEEISKRAWPVVMLDLINFPRVQRLGKSEKSDGKGSKLYPGRDLPACLPPKVLSCKATNECSKL